MGPQLGLGAALEARRVQLWPADSLIAELEAFADAVEGRAPFPVTPAQMLDTVAAFEATIRAIETGEPAEVDAGSMPGNHDH